MVMVLRLQIIYTLEVSYWSQNPSLATICKPPQRHLLMVLLPLSMKVGTEARMQPINSTLTSSKT